MGVLVCVRVCARVFVFVSVTLVVLGLLGFVRLCLASRCPALFGFACLVFVWRLLAGTFGRDRGRSFARAINLAYAVH